MTYYTNLQEWTSTDLGSVTKTLNLSFTPSVGSLLVMFAVAPATFTTPSGWTRGPEDLGSWASVVFIKTATGSETTIEWTQNGPRSAAAVVYEFPPGTTITSPGAWVYYSSLVVESGSVLTSLANGTFIRCNVGVASIGTGTNRLSPTGDLVEDSELVAEVATTEDSWLWCGHKDFTNGGSVAIAWSTPAGTVTALAINMQLTVPAGVSGGPTGQFYPSGGSVAAGGGGGASQSDIDSAVADHEAAADPHPVYLTQTEGDARYTGRYRGVWNPGIAYDAGDTVFYVDGEWGATAAVSSGNEPVDTAPTTSVPVGADNIESAPSILVAADGASASSIHFANTGFTSQSGEPVVHNFSNARSCWYKYTPITSGSMTISTEGSTGSPAPDTNLGLYKLNTASFGTFADISLVASNDDGGANFTSVINFSAIANTVYYIQIGAYQSRAIDYKFNIANARRTDPPASSWKRLSVDKSLLPTSAGHTIQEEGTALAARTGLNFIGTAVTAVDDSGNNRTNVTITSNPVQATWSMGPAVVASTGGYKWRAKRNYTITKVSADLGTAPGAGESFDVDVTKNGVSVLSSSMVFSSGDLTKDGALSTTAVTTDDYLEVMVSSVTGSTAQRLTVNVEMV